MKTSLFPSFSETEYQRRYRHIRHMMAAHELSALIIYGDSAMSRSAQADLHYISNFLGNRPNYALFPVAGEPTLLVQSFNHVPDGQRASIIDDTRFGGTDSAETITHLLHEHGLTTGLIGLVGPMPYTAYLTLSQQLPNVHFRNVTGPYRLLRAHKSDEEVDWMRRGAAFTDAAMFALEDQARPGLSEAQLAAIVENAYLNDGGQSVIHYISTTSMHRSDRCAPAQNHSDRLLQKGDVILTEISAAYWGYAGQILRPISLAEAPTPDYQDLYRVAEEAYYRVAEAIKPGATAQEVLAAGAFIDDTPYTICDSLVHGFGIGLLQPSIRTPATQPQALGEFVFKPNMCVVIQPNIITPDYQKGVQLGNLGLVTETGFDSLQKYPINFVETANH
ncbi:MAG: aminopeptidase P family protein [Anaerolineae bacterium]|nr:aminopeptidase P family protein [Anaerolineae bacterium]